MSTRRGFLQAVAAVALAAPLSRAMKLADGLAALEAPAQSSWLTVNHTQIFRAGDIVRFVPTGEIMRVTAVTAPRKIAVTRMQ